MRRSSIQLNLPVNLRNQRRLHDRVDQIFEDYSKVLAVRLDLYLKKDYADINTYEYMNEAFRRLLNNKRSNRLFDHYISHEVKLEHGADRLWHFHVVFFFDGQKIKNDYLLAQSIGEYWVRVITRGLGDYYSPNMNANKYEVFALGMIDYSEEECIENLKAVLDYLAKEERGEPARRDKAGKTYRSYRQSQYKPRNRVLGRPRLY